MFDLICILRLIRIIITWKRILVSFWRSVDFILAHHIMWPTTEAIQAIRLSSSILWSCEYCTEIRKDADCKPSAVRTEGANYRGVFVRYLGRTSMSVVTEHCSCIMNWPRAPWQWQPEACISRTVTGIVYQQVTIISDIVVNLSWQNSTTH